jgi:hypothetical protein
MAYDAEPGGDPRGPWCPKCRLPVKDGEPSTKMQFTSDPDGKLGLSGIWHGECAKPFWDTVTPQLKSFGGF